MERIGAAHFASPRSFAESNADRSAWIAAGEAAPIRLVEGLVDLPTGLWWTNLDYADLSRANLIGRPDLKAASWLATRPKGVIAELGLAEGSPAEQAATCGRIFDRVMRRAHALFGLPLAPPGNTLGDALREHFFRDPPRGPMEDAAVQYAVDAASQPFTQSGSGESFDDSQLVVLRHHRQQYAADMLATPLPFGDWRPLQVPTGAAAQRSWVAEHDGSIPLLMRVNVVFKGGDRHERMLLAGFGSGPRRGVIDAGARQWLATPEYLALAPYADIEVLEAFGAEGFVPNRWLMAEPVSDGPIEKTHIQIGPLRLAGRGALSYSDGLLVESMWHGATRSRSSHRTPDAMWLVATDRARCIETAFGIADRRFEGLQVAGFSRGRIWLRLNAQILSTPEDQAHLIAEVVMVSGLVPPALPEVQSMAHGRLRIAQSVRERAGQLGMSGAAAFASAMNILGNRAILAEAM